MTPGKKDGATDKPQFNPEFNQIGAAKAPLQNSGLVKTLTNETTANARVASKAERASTTSPHELHKNAKQSKGDKNCK